MTILFRVAENKQAALLEDIQELIASNHDAENTVNSNAPFTPLLTFLTMHLPRYLEGLDGKPLNSGIMRSRLEDDGVKIKNSGQLRDLLALRGNTVIDSQKTLYLSTIEGLDDALPFIDKLPNKVKPERIFKLPDIPDSTVSKNTIVTTDPFWDKEANRNSEG